MALIDSRKITTGLVSSAPERKRAKCGKHNKGQDSANDEAASALVNVTDATSPLNPITTIQSSYRSDLDNFLTKTPNELEQAEAALYHQLSLISEAKALNNIPGGKLEKFILFNKVPLEIQKTIWEEAVSQEQEVFVIEAYRAKTQPAFHSKIVHFKCYSKLNSLLKTCVGSRETVLKYRSTAVGQDLPGFDGVIHINPDNDLVILNNIKDAYSTEGIMKAVKNVLVTSDRGLVDRRHRMDLDFAKAIHKMFPDLTILFVANHVGSYIKCYIKNPDAFKLVPTEAVRNSNYAFNPAVWPRVWTKMQVELGIDTACPELKVMKVVKRTEARGYMYGNAG